MILGASYGTVGDIEIMWCLIAAVGIVFSLFNVREARDDKRALIRAHVANGRKKIANFNLLAEALRLIKQCIFLMIGILALVLPQGDTSKMPLVQVLIQAAVTWGLIVASSIVTFHSYLGFRFRRTLKEEK